MSEFDQVAGMMPDPLRILWREKVSSTNDELRALGNQGAAAGLILIAEEQTAGRGRRGAQWLCHTGEGLAFSILLRPAANKSLWHRLSLTAGLAVAEALEKFVPLAEIKWPNDVRIAGRKVAGILVEAGPDFVIVGIGINVNPELFPEELSATSLRLQCGQEVSRAEVLLEVVERLARHSEKIETGFEGVLRGVRERCVLTGHRVSLITADKKAHALIKGIGASGELLAEIDGRLEKLFQADEVRLIED